MRIKNELRAICLFDTFFIHPVEFNFGLEVWILSLRIVSHCAIRKKREYLKISAKVYLLFTVIVLGKLFATIEALSSRSAVTSLGTTAPRVD